MANIIFTTAQVPTSISYTTWVNTNTDTSQNTITESGGIYTVTLYVPNTVNDGPSFRNDSNLLTMNIEYGSLRNTINVSGCSNLTAYYIDCPTVEGNTINSCSNLTTIHFGENVRRIEYSNFEKLYALANLSVDSNNTYYNDNNGGNCILSTNNALVLGTNTSNIPNNITSISPSAFNGCTALTSFTIPSSVTSIGDNAFSNSGLTTITIPSSVLDIKYGVFSGCTALTSITLPDNLITIGDNAFEGCTNLINFTIPNSVRFIGNNVFNNTSYWNSQINGIVYKDGWAIGKKNYTPTSLNELASNTKGLCKKLFYGTSITSTETPSSVKYLSDGVFANCQNLENVIISENIESIYFTFDNVEGLFKNSNNITSITFNSDFISDSSEKILSYNYTPASIRTLIFGNNVHTVNEYIASHNRNITSVIFGNSVTTIGDKAFEYCQNITSITLPESLTTLETSCFAGCTALTSITLPESLTSITSNCFQYCTGLTSVTWNARNCTSNSQTSPFINSNNITSVIFGNNVNVIPEFLFSEITSITSITLPESLTEIKRNAFRGCTALTSITLPESLTEIEWNAFRGCTGLTSVTWNARNCTSNSQTSPFINSNNITSVIFGNNVNVIPQFLFSEITSITSITLPESLTTLKTSCFAGCTALTSITLPESLTEIEWAAFRGCTALTSITLPSSVTTIGQQTFYNCSNLTTVICKATTPPTLGTYNFTVSGDTLYMPIASKSAYQSASNWSTAFTYYKGLCEISTSTDGNGTITPTELVVEGESFTVTATPNEHYKVSHFIVDGVDVGTVDNYTFQNLDTDHTIEAYFELITHTITATAFEGGAIVPSGAITVNEGENQSFDIVTLEGYGILALFIDGTQIGPVETYTFTDVEADHTIDAMFYPLRVAGFNRDEMLDIDYILQDYLEQLKKRD